MSAVLSSRIRVDLFINEHIQALNTELTTAISKAIKQKQKQSNDDRDNDDVEPSPPIKSRQTESKRLNNSSQAAKPNRDRGNYSILDPRMRSHINYRVPMLPNGSEFQRGRNSYVVSNTCAIDTIVTVKAASYIDNTHIRNEMNGSSCKFAALVKLLFERKKIDSTIEFARFELLKENSPDDKAIQQINSLTYFNCETSVQGLISNMCSSNADILSSRRRTGNCSTCGTRWDFEAPFLNFNIEGFAFNNIQNSILPEKTRVCEKCLKKTMIVTETFSSTIAIDTEHVFQIDRQSTKINEIQNEINLNGEKYELSACIEHDPSIKHYIAHVKRKTNNWETYDDLARTKSDTDMEEERLIFVLFYGKKLNGWYMLIDWYKFL